MSQAGDLNFLFFDSNEQKVKWISLHFVNDRIIFLLSLLPLF